MEKTTEEKEIVIDELAAQYELHDKLGEGGQGAVYSTNFDKVLVKLLNTKKLSQNKKIEFNKKMKFLRRLNLENINVSLPIVLLANEHTGYIMELMDEMIPLSKLLVLEDGIDIKQWYLKTGGIKRRLTLLLKLAKIVNDLHSEGLAFGDISPANIFISENPEYSEVQLIDCDNITPVSDIGNDWIFTADYAAPEMIREESGYNTLTDAWSFSIIAFQLMTLNHPFKGIIFEEIEVEQADEKLANGSLPWIFDNDTSNESTGNGVPPELVVSPKMMLLFQKTFAQSKSIDTRATMQEWITVLETVLYSLQTCSNSECSTSFLYKKKNKCPFCDSKNKQFIILKTIRWEPDRKQDDNEELLDTSPRYRDLPLLGLPKVILNQGESIDISRNLFEDFIEDGTSLRFDYKDNGILRLIPKDNKQITLRVCEDKDSISYIEGKEHLLGKAVKISPGGVRRHYAVHLGELNEPHRVIIFDWLGR